MLGKTAIYVEITVMYHMSQVVVYVTSRTNTMEVCKSVTFGVMAKLHFILTSYER